MTFRSRGIAMARRSSQRGGPSVSRGLTTTFAPFTSRRRRSRELYRAVLPSDLIPEETSEAWRKLYAR